ADAYERRPRPDVGDPHLAVAALLRLGAATGVALDDAVAGKAFQDASDRAAADAIVGAQLLLTWYDGAGRPRPQPQLHGKVGRHLVVQWHHRLGLKPVQRHALG